MVVCLLWRKSEFYSPKPDLRLDRDPRGPGAALHLDFDPSPFLVLGPRVGGGEERGNVPGYRPSLGAFN